jgi:hypothetical protein
VKCDLHLEVMSTVQSVALFLNFVKMCIHCNYLLKILMLCVLCNNDMVIV